MYSFAKSKFKLFKASKKPYIKLCYFYNLFDQIAYKSRLTIDPMMFKFQACKNPYKNRYSNLSPFDTNLVLLDNEERYVNASWIDLPGTYSIKILNSF